MLIWNLATVSPSFHWTLATGGSHNLLPRKKDLQVEGMIRSHLFLGHNKQSLRSGRKKEEPVEGDSQQGSLLIWQARSSLGWALIPSVVRPPKCLEKYLNRRTSQRYALKEGMLLVAHCGFTIHEPGLYSSSTEKALFNIVILKLCACLSFSYWQQLEKMAKWGWGGGEERWRRIKTLEQMTYNFTDKWTSRSSHVIGIKV